MASVDVCLPCKLIIYVVDIHWIIKLAFFAIIVLLTCRELPLLSERFIAKQRKLF